MKNRSTGRLGRLFLNAVTLESRSPGSVVTNKRNTTDAGLKPSRMTLCDATAKVPMAAQHSRRTSFYNDKKTSTCFGGFTLIELLVVVLIIGILSAIALPQYTTAVEKARAMEAVQNMATMEKQMELYLLESGLPKTNFETVYYKDFASAQLTGGTWQGNVYKTKYFVYYGGIDAGGASIEAEHNNYALLSYNHPVEDYNIDSPTGGWYRACVTQEEDLGRKVCKQLESAGFKYSDNQF